MNRHRLKLFLCTLAAFAAGLLLRLYFVALLSRVAGDSLLYGDIAKTWLQHGVYGFTESGRFGGIVFRPTLIRLPGYPLFLAACFRLFGIEHYHAVLYVQIAADLVTCGLVSALAARLFGRSARLPALWIAALCPFTANYVALPLTETLVLTTIALALYAFVRWQDAGLGFNRWLWIAAAAMAYSILLRPDQVLLSAAILPAMLWASLATPARLSRKASRTVSALRIRPILPVFVAALCVILPLIPWTLRNQRTFHVFQPLAPYYANDPGDPAPLGFNRWYRTWGVEFITTETVYWRYDGDRIDLSDLPARAFDAGSPEATANLRRRTADLLDDYNRNPVLTPAIDARFASLARERIDRHPILCHIGLPAARLADMLLRPRTDMMPFNEPWWHWRDHPQQSVFALAYAALNLACFALAFASLARWCRRAWLAPNVLGLLFRSFRSSFYSEDYSSFRSYCLPFRRFFCLSFRSLFCLSFRSEAKESAFSRTTTDHSITENALIFATLAYVLLRSALLLTIDNSEPRYTLEFFPILLIWIAALFPPPSPTPSPPAA